jgi:hypothetical protein
VAAPRPGGWLVDKELDSASLLPDRTKYPDEILLKTHLAMMRRVNFEQLRGAMISGGYITEKEIVRDIAQLEDAHFITAPRCKAAGFAFIGAKRRALAEVADGSGAGFRKKRNVL